MFTTSYQVAKIWGIPIRVHISLLIALFIVAQQTGPEFGGSWLGWIAGFVLGIGFFTSIVLHELGHSIVAIRKGARVREITLMVVGGAARIERLPEGPRDEFAIAIAGPAVSLLLGLLFFFGAPYVPVPPRWGYLIQLLGVINLGLLVFNLLPAFPMDGGRVLRALLTRKLGRLRATAAAARIGQIIAILFGFHGLTHHNYILVAVAVFVFISAGNENRMVIRQERAKRGEPRWPFFGPITVDPPPGDVDKVIISPPPYEQGPGSESDVRPDRGTPSGFVG